MEDPQPKEPVCLRMTSLFGSNEGEKDRKIRQYITDHCSHCPTFYDDNLARSLSQCPDQLCVYILWFYKHYLTNHKKSVTEACSTCDSCMRLYRWMRAHSAECLGQVSRCCLSLCLKMKKSQHLTNLGRTDHDFIRQVEGLSHPQAPSRSQSLPASQHDNYVNGLVEHSSLIARDDPRAGTPSRQNGSQLSLCLARNPAHISTHNHTPEQRSPIPQTYPPADATLHTPQGSHSSANFNQMQKQMLPQYYPHARSYTDLPQLQQGPNVYPTSNGHTHHHCQKITTPDVNVTLSGNLTDFNGHQQRPVHSGVYTAHTATSCDVHGQYNETPSQDYSEDSSYQTSFCGGAIRNTPRMNGNLTNNVDHAITQNCACQLATPTMGDLKLSRQYSNTSSGYGTANSTGRQSVTSILSRDQSLSELPPVEPLNSLQVGSRSRRVSAPDHNTSDRRKNMVSQQSQSLTNLPEYSVDIEEPNETPDSNYCNYVKVEGHNTAMSGNYQPSLQRQDTGHETKVVFPSYSERSVDGEQYQAMMGSKRKWPDKQKPLEEPADSSPSPPVTKRPLQREESDVSGKSKVVLNSEGNRCGSNSLTRFQYDSILKFQEQHGIGILSDQQTREKVLSKQRKQVAASERRLRQGTVNSDVQSDFDTESSTSDIPGSSPLTSGEFSELDHDLTDTDEDKKAGETEAMVTELTQGQMTVEEQVQAIRKMTQSLPLNAANIPEKLYGHHPSIARMKNDHGISLPPDMVMSPLTYGNSPSIHPLHSLPQDLITSNASSSSMSDGTSTLESERFSNNTLKEEEHFHSSRFSVGSNDQVTTLSSTEGSTLTCGSPEDRFASLRQSSGASSERNEDVKGMVNFSSLNSLPGYFQPTSLSHNSHLKGHFSGSHQTQVIADASPSSPMNTSHSESERTSYNRWSMQSEEDNKFQSIESEMTASPSPIPPLYQLGKYRLPSIQLEEMYKTVDNVKERYRDELDRLKHKGELIKQEIPDLTDEEQRRKIPGFWMYMDEESDPKVMYRGEWSRTLPESKFPDLERRYYHETLNERFSEKEEEIAKDVERRHLLKRHLLGKFHSGHAYREGAHWHRKTKLGKGGQAECFGIQDVQTEMIMALKETREDSKILDEAYVCMKLSSLSNASQNIVDYYCAAMLPKEHSWRRMSLVQVFMEMVPACLHAWLQDSGPFSIDDLHHFGYQLFDALDYLHSTLRVIHCDVKPANLLLDYTAQRLKLTDFGFAQLLDEYCNEVRADDNAGTLSYNPPEHYREKRCSFALDIWQAGCTLLTMATTRRPWRHLFLDVVKKGQSSQFVQVVRRSQASLIGQQTSGHMYPSFLDESLKKLLHGCLHPDPQSRLSAQDCVYHLNTGTPHMNERQRNKIIGAIGYWRSPPVLSTYQDAHTVDVYLETTRHAIVDGTRFSLSPGWLGCVPHQEGMTYQQLENDILPQHFPVMQHLSPIQLSVSVNSPQSIFMKTLNHPIDFTFEPAQPQSLVDRTKAIVIVASKSDK